MSDTIKPIDAEAPTLRTFQDIIAMGASFQMEFYGLQQTLTSTLTRLHQYVYIPVEVYPEEPVDGWTVGNPRPAPTIEYKWHPNAKTLFSEAELQCIYNYHAKLTDMLEFTSTFSSENSAELSILFNATPKLNYVLGQALAGVISG